MMPVLSEISAEETIRHYRPGDKIEFDSVRTIIDDHYYALAFEELSQMLDGKQPYSMKRAAFLLEWAYYEGKPDYRQFSHDIDSIVNVLRMFIKVNGLQKYKTAPNFAIFQYYTVPSIMNGNKAFSYDFEDCTAEKDYSKACISKLVKTHTGQCTSLHVLHKSCAMNSAENPRWLLLLSMST